jgi:hypothetical protein
MAVGALLLRPERVRAAVDAPASAGLGSDLFAVVTAVVADAARDQPRIPPAAEAAFGALGERLAARMASGLEAAGDRIGGVVDPLVQALLAPVEAAGDDPAALVEALGQLVTGVVDAAADLDLDALEAGVATVVDALTADLGLTFEVLREELLATVDQIADALAADEPALAAALRRLRRRMAGMPLPELDLVALVRPLLDDLRRRGLDRAAELVGCVADQVREATGHAAAIGHATTLTPPVPVGDLDTGRAPAAALAAAAAQGERHAWYATWLLGYKRPFGTQLGLYLVPWEGSDEVWVADGQVTRRNKWRADQSLGPGADWPDALIFNADAALSDLQANGLEGHIIFGRTSPATMETVALWSAVAVAGLEALVHLYSLEEGDYASNIGQVFTNTVAALAAGTGQVPLPWWFDHLGLRTLYTLLASLESTQTRVGPGNWFLFWLTLVGPDLGEVLITHLAVHALRDLLLSILTLSNHTLASGDARKAQNRLEVDGVVAVFTWLAGKLAMAIIPRKDYNLLFTDAGNTATLLLLHGLVVGPILAMFGFIGGWIVARLIAQDRTDSVGFGAGVGKAALVASLTFVPSLYLAKEGDTAGGTFNPDGPPDFNGYPDPENSPYRLPYAQGLSIYVGQANQGFFSHHTLTGEVYAIDFGLDQDEPVLAARPGTVVDFFQAEPDGSTARNNFIIIRHDVDDNGLAVAPDANHDRDAGGVVVRTYAAYRHGRQNSIDAAFGGVRPTRGVTRVRQGQPIMLAGDTGKSFHNHLHMEVYPDNGASPPTDPVDPATGAPVSSPDNADRDRTIPFVFADVRHDWRSLGSRDQGVPYHFDFYTAGG